MRLHLHRVALPLAHPFTIARGSTSVRHSLIVGLQHEDHIGWGEASENAFYGVTLDSMIASIERVRSLLQGYRFGNPAELWELLWAQIAEDTFAVSALDAAAHDLFGKLCGRPTHELLGLSWQQVPDSSYTIGIDRIETMVAKLEEQPGWSIYKIKLGTPDDVEIMRQLRDRTSARLRVDANGGWTLDTAIANSHALAQLGVEFIEQPLPTTASRCDHRRLYEQSALPIIADESCQRESDLDWCRDHFHGINVKLCKCGGLTPAVRMLRAARAAGMRTMIGCMIESSIGISAAAQLLPLLDDADLDGAVLLAADPARGVTVTDGHVAICADAGNGGQPVAPLWTA